MKLLEGRLQVKEEERDSPTVQALKEIEYQLRRIGRNVNQIAHNANREMNATIEDEASASYAVRQCRELIDHLDTVIGQSGECLMTREPVRGEVRALPDGPPEVPGPPR
ncbi:MAG: plasmid mobilization relaxosome protein MobC [Bifidobacterium adolescentis]